MNNPQGAGTARTLPDISADNPIAVDVPSTKDRKRVHDQNLTGSRCWEGGKREVNEEEELELELERELDPTGA
jgi:hypothetical protein